MHYTYLFDMGLPDQDDPQVEEQGGKWWGRAILRGGERRTTSFIMAEP